MMPSDRLVFVNGLPDCADCLAFIDEQPFLVSACASVGIEFGKSISRMAMEYIAGFHGRSHEQVG